MFGGACGDDKDDKGGSSSGGSDSGIDTSASRIAAVSRALCQQYAECYADGFKEYYDSIDDCVRSYQEDVPTIETDEDKACLDALLDFYSCYAELGCDAEDEPACDELDEKSDELCPDDFLEARVQKSSRAGRGRFRIPR